VQADGLVPPGVGLIVPGGHQTGAVHPDIQYSPIGQRKVPNPSPFAVDAPL